MESCTMKGCSILFVNEKDEILLLLRDDVPSIPYPNMWDIPGGKVEENETPAQCIVREIKEEMGLDLDEFQLFSICKLDDRTEYTFWGSASLDIDAIPLTEGQQLKWFSQDELKHTEIAFGFNRIIEDFFDKSPFSYPI